MIGDLIPFVAIDGTARYFDPRDAIQGWPVEIERPPAPSGLESWHGSGPQTYMLDPLAGLSGAVFRLVGGTWIVVPDGAKAWELTPDDTIDLFCRAGLELPHPLTKLVEERTHDPKAEVGKRLFAAYRGFHEAHVNATGGEQPDEDGTGYEKASVEHSLDFRCVLWFGENYGFTATQAAVVKILWQEWERGTPDVGEQTVLAEIESSRGGRLRDIFKVSKNEMHPAWGSMIRKGASKGAFRLEPPSDKNS